MYVIEDVVRHVLVAVKLSAFNTDLSLWHNGLCIWMTVQELCRGDQ